MSAPGDLRSLTEISPPSTAVAVFVHRGSDGAHAGLAYRLNTAGEYRLLHQAWHLVTRPSDTVADWSAELRKTLRGEVALWWVLPGLDEDELDSLRTAAAQVAQSLGERQLPYSMDRRDAAIDSQGVVNLGESLGLTCSSLVRLVFENAGVALLDANSWESDRSADRVLEDIVVHQRIVEALKKRDPAHAGRVQQDVNCVRVRAEEVAACSGCEPRPVSFVDAEVLGRSILARL